MKHIFIINPAAGKYDHSQQFRKQIEEACGARGLAYEICVSKKPGDCRDIARKAAESGEEVRLYACGGDGTLNEVVNGVVGFPNAPSRISRAAPETMPSRSSPRRSRFSSSNGCWMRTRRASI